MAGPGDEIAAGAGGHGLLRASRADREQVIGTLKAAFVAGMLAKDEFDLRVDQALVSRSCADLAALTADLPAGLAVAKPPQPVREQGGQAVPRPGRWLAVATAVYTGICAYEVFLSPHGGDNSSFSGLIGGGFFYVMLANVFVDDGRRAAGEALRRQSPRRPAPDGRPGTPAPAIGRPGRGQPPPSRSWSPAHRRSCTGQSPSPSVARMAASR